MSIISRKNHCERDPYRIGDNSYSSSAKDLDVGKEENLGIFTARPRLRVKKLLAVPIIEHNFLFLLKC